jgi:hypothetical protein
MINSDLGRLHEAAAPSCEACRYEHLTPPRSQRPAGSPVPRLVPFLAGTVTSILLPGDGTVRSPRLVSVAIFRPRPLLPAVSGPRQSRRRCSGRPWPDHFYVPVPQPDKVFILGAQVLVILQGIIQFAATILSASAPSRTTSFLPRPQREAALCWTSN